MCALTYIGVAWGIAMLSGLDDQFSLTAYIGRGFSMFAIAGGLWAIGTVVHLLFTLATERPARPLVAMEEIIRTRYRPIERLAVGLPILVLMPIAGSAFTSLKSMIPALHSFDWDRTFIAWDRWFHGGSQPWELLQPLLGHAPVTRLIDGAYHAWFILLYLTIFVLAFSLKPRRLRAQFLITCLLAWAVLGNLMATALASVGPIFYQPLTGDPLFAPLTDYLRAVDTEFPLATLKIQQYLWDGYAGGEMMIGGGISAMPSLHIASALLFVLVWRRINRPLGWGTGVFFVVMLLGSVHLGYHYAIDGYVSIVLTLVLWKLTGRLLERDRGLDRTALEPLANAAPARRPGYETATAS